MFLRNLLRTAIIRTNRYWPFTVLNRLPYYLAIRVFVLSFSKFPEVRSIYLRHGLTRQHWVPAISDIDLTVILNDNLSISRETEFLGTFWKRYKRLKTIFPMIGEIGILDADSLSSWTLFTIRGYEARNWKLIYGCDSDRRHYNACAARIATDSLNYALWTYQDHFLKRYFQPESPLYISYQEIKRLTWKITFYAKHYLGSAPDKETCKCKPSGKEALFAAALKELARSAKVLNETVPAPLTVQQQEVSRNYVIRPEKRLPQTMTASRSFSEERDIVKAIYHTANTIYIVLDDNRDSAELENFLINNHSRFIEGDIGPVILTASVFEYLIKTCNPFIYENLTSKPMLKAGFDIVKRILPPPEGAIINKILSSYTLTLLAFPRGPEIWQAMDSKSCNSRLLQTVLERALIIKHFIETRKVHSRYGDNLRDCRKRYHHYFHELDNLSNNANKGLRDTTKELYEFYRKIMAELHDSIIKSDIVDDLFNQKTVECDAVI